MRGDQRECGPFPWHHTAPVCVLYPVLWSSQSTALCHLTCSPRKFLKRVGQVSLFDLHQGNWNSGSHSLPRITPLVVVHRMLKLRSSSSRFYGPKVIVLHWNVRYDVYGFLVVWPYHLSVDLRNNTEGWGSTLLLWLSPMYNDILTPIPPPKEGGTLFGYALIVKLC